MISVIVCTYNRADLLNSCLESLIDQTTVKDQYEVIIIDNNSSDKTEVVAAHFVSDYPNFRYIKELNQGLSHARNRGYKEAKGEYVAYIDDDGRAEKNWVEEILSFIKKNPEAMAFGGPYKHFYMRPPPPWYKDSYGSWSLGDKEKLLEENEFLKGTNMIFNRSLLMETGGFSTTIGMKGETISYGEETHLVLKLRRMNISVYYVPAIKVKHLVAEYKINILWRTRATIMAGYSMYETFSYPRRPVRQLLYSLFLFLKGFIKITYCREKYLRVRIFESFREFLWNLGLTLRMFKK